MRKFVPLIMLFVLLTPLLGTAQDAEDLARFAAEQWIVLVDDGQYSKSWEEASTMFRDGNPRDQWESKAQGMREPLGGKQYRKLKGLKITNAVKGLPGGAQYVLVKYESSYEKKKLAAETVVAVLDPDGKWRVAAYQIN